MIRGMGRKWAGAPIWLRVACVLGVPWCIALVVLGVLVKPGPGLPLIWLGMFGLSPWFFLLLRDEHRSGGA